MKKGILFLLSIGLVLSFIFINNVLASEYSICIKGCVNNTQTSINECISMFNTCSDDAKSQLKDCSIYSGQNKTTCIKDARSELAKCNADKKTCLKNIHSSVNRCKKKCSYIGKNITCEKGRYNAGEVFLNKCDRCECNSNGKVSCKTTEYCNFDSFDTSKESCEGSNGLFQKLCAGSIMSTKCTQEVYCQCGGKLNYSCGNDSVCLYDFYLNKNRRGQFAQEWIRLEEYKKLGNIGICVKKPQMSNCGNGVCNNICDNDNCSLSETSYNCPEDCR